MGGNVSVVGEEGTDGAVGAAHLSSAERDVTSDICGFCTDDSWSSSAAMSSSSVATEDVSSPSS